MMQSISREHVEIRCPAEPSAMAAVWPAISVERAGLFVLLCLIWGVVLYLALQTL